MTALATSSTSPGVCLVTHGAEPDVLEVQLLGIIDQHTVEQLLHELARRSARRPYILVDLRQVTELTAAARTQLVAVARALVARSDRRAWLASSPRGRGIALWVLHVCPDTYAQVVSHPRAAHRWLRSHTTRCGAHEASMQAYTAGRAP